MRIGDIVSLGAAASAGEAHENRLGLVFHIQDTGQELLVATMTPLDGIDSPPEHAVPVGDGDLEAGKLGDEYLVRTDRILTVSGANCSPAGHLGKTRLDQVLRKMTAMMVRSHYRAIHVQDDFVAGRSRIPYGGRVYDDGEMVNLVNASLDFWLTSGPYAERFERAFAEFLGTGYCSLTNSGSSANLLAFMAITSPRLGERRLRRGDEVITVAAAFPTTVAPVVQFGAVPVFVDIQLPFYNVDCGCLEQALSERTRAVMLAHTLGNPFDVDRVLAFCRKHDLWLIEDCCDALGSTYASTLPPAHHSSIVPRPSSIVPRPSSIVHRPSSLVPRRSSLVHRPSSIVHRPSSLVGTFGHLSTFSFYPAHHITMGEGGAVCTRDAELRRIVDSLRDWGRDCCCPPGKDNTCGKRFSRQMGQLPFGYDHKYVYSHMGYNLKVTDMQAAVGLAQLQKAAGFIEARKRNWRLLLEGLADLEEFLTLPEPLPGSDPSWFGFLLTVREQVGFSRDEIVAHLESRGIQTRMLFSGNLLRHPCFDELRAERGAYRTVGPLTVTDRAMRDSFWVGVYPGLDTQRISFLIEEIHAAVSVLVHKT
ncbi:MAG: lipopolysaccharide biosynthesis protein RfbH [Thermodesulfobacteriota bacterium]